MSAKQPATSSLTTPSPPSSRRPPSPHRARERTSSFSSPSSSSSVSSKSSTTTSPSSSPTSSRDPNKSKDKERRLRASSSPSAPASNSSTASSTLPPASSSHSKGERLSLTSSREKVTLTPSATLLSAATVTSTSKERKEETTAEGTHKSYRKRLPPRLTLGEEKDDSYSIRFSPDNQFVVAGGGDGGIRVYNTSSGKLTYHLVSAYSSHASSSLLLALVSLILLDGSHISPDNLPVTCLRFRPNTQYATTKNILISAHAGGMVRHWHTTTGKCVHTITEQDNQVYAVDFRQDAERFATAGKDYKIRLYDESKRTLAATLSGGHGDVTAGHASRVFSLKFSPTQPDVIISGGWDNTIQIWDTRVSYAVRSIFGPHICGDAVDIHGDTILSGSWRPEKALQTWDFGSGRLIDTFDWRSALGEEPCLLYAAQFSKGNGAEYVAAGGSGSNEAKLFNHKTKQVVGEVYGFRRGIYTIDFSSDSKMLVVGGSGILQLFELHLNE